MNITPEQADQWSQRATGGPWYVHTVPGHPDETCIYDETGNMCIAVEPAGSDYLEADLTIAAAAPDLAQTIAGMEWEYGLRQPRPEPHAEGELYTSWGYRLFAAKAAFAGLTDRGVECYIVRRLAGPVEVVDGE